MQKEALITIRGGQLSDGTKDSLELMTDGFFEKLNDGYRITYNESEMTGMLGVVTEIQTDGKYVIMNRKGDFTSQMIFESGTRHLCRYNTPAGYMNMAVTTSEIKNTMTPKGGSIQLNYTLEIDNKYVSSNNFYIKVKEKVNGNACKQDQ